MQHNIDIASAGADVAAAKTIPVWDILVRAGHWTVLVAFFTAYFTEDDFMTAHVWAGYTVATVIAIRVLWGFAGSKHARFSDFVRSPAVTLQYLRDMLSHRARRYIGHNPAGAAMVIALLLSLAGTTGTGMMLYAIEEGAGPLAGWAANNTVDTEAFSFPSPLSSAYADDDDKGSRHSGDEDAREEFWEETHEFFTNLMLLLIAIHVAGVLYSSYLHHENLILAMVTGRKRESTQ